jgi:hypothetical protein
LAANLAQLPVDNVFTSPSAPTPGEPSECRQIPFGVALPYVNAQVGHPLSVAAILAQWTRPQRSARARDRLVGSVFHDRANTAGKQLGGTGPVERIGIDLDRGVGQHGLTSGKCGIDGPEMRQ